MLCSNIRGLRNNFTELKYVIKKRKPNICLLNETHLTHDCDLNGLTINGYKLYNCFSHSKHTGGVSVFIDNKIKHSKMSIVEKSIAWFISLQIIIDHVKIVIAGIYLSASENKQLVLDSFENWCLKISENKTVLIAGDFNVDLLSNTVFSRRLKNFGDDNGLSILVSKPTRIDENSATMIDLCLSNVNKNKLSCKVLDEDQISDHHMIETIIYGKSITSNQKQRKICVSKNYDTQKMWNSVENLSPSWESVRSDSVNNKTDWLLQILTRAAGQLKEEKIIKSKENFFDAELEQMRRDKNNLYKLAQYSSPVDADINWLNYRKFKNDYKRTIQKKKNECNQKKLANAKGDMNMQHKKR